MYWLFLLSAERSEWTEHSRSGFGHLLFDICLVTFCFVSSVFYVARRTSDDILMICCVRFTDNLTCSVTVTGVVTGVQSLEYSHWSTVTGVQSLEYSHWSTVTGLQSLDYSHWSTVTGCRVRSGCWYALVNLFSHMSWKEIAFEIHMKNISFWPSQQLSRYFNNSGIILCRFNSVFSLLWKQNLVLPSSTTF